MDPETVALVLLHALITHGGVVPGDAPMIVKRAFDIADVFMKEVEKRCAQDP